MSWLKLLFGAAYPTLKTDTVSSERKEASPNVDPSTLSRGEERHFGKTSPSTFQEGDKVTYDGRTGKITNVWEDMFGNKKYDISFNWAEKVKGIPEDELPVGLT